MSKSLHQAIQFDQQHIWHPYTSMTDPLPCYHVESAHGCEIKLSTGERLVDGMSSWWAAIHGYNHPQLNEALHAQADKMSHVMFGGLTHQPAIEMVERLIDLAPEPLDRVFIADSGSVSVEVAIKMALQYWFSIGKPQKNQLLTIRGGYHGDTFAAMSVCDPVNGMHHMFRHALCNQRFVERPAVVFGEQWDPNSLSEIQQTLEQHHADIAAVIVEPVVQGAGGMRFYHPEYLSQLRQLCDEFEVLLIADEIATGFGRTGKLFGCDHAGIVPDIMCVGKALTGGYMTLAATLTHRKVAEAIGQGEGGGALMHGPTFMGNPLACAVASASLALIQQGEWQTQVPQIEKQLNEQLKPLANSPAVNEVRVLGAIGVVELTQPVDVARTQALFVELGVWIRPFGRLMYIMPPYCISSAQLTQLTAAISHYVTTVAN